MYIFGHIGITLGIVIIISYLIPQLRNKLNLWFVGLGAILPDLIDKTTGRIIFAESIANGRIFAHTLSFVLLLTILTIILYKYNSKYSIPSGSVAAASFMHLLEDGMWETPQTLFWPLLGWGFPEGLDYDNWLSLIFIASKSAFTPELSYSFFAEAIGLVIILFLCFRGALNKFKKNSRK